VYWGRVQAGVKENIENLRRIFVSVNAKIDINFILF
jgi:hypothetical protein